MAATEGVPSSLVAVVVCFLSTVTVPWCFLSDSGPQCFF